MKKIFILLFILVFMGCATTQRGFQAKNVNRIDESSITDREKYQADYDYCCDVAAKIDGQAIGEAGKRGVGGAVFGGIMGAAIGGILRGGRGAAGGAALGGVLGAGSGVATTPIHGEEAFCNCMRNRGYVLLY